MSYSNTPDRVYERDVKAALTQVMTLYPKGTRFDYEPVEANAGAPARLWIMEDTGRVPFPGLDLGMLGWTRREARRTLLGIVAGADAQRLIQAETIRAARRMVDRSGLSWSNEEVNDLAAKLDELAPPGEF